MSGSAGEVRKVVTIVFTDLVGSTALGERLDPETLRHVMSRYFDAMQAALERHGGTVEKFIGDAIMAVFGIPTLHEDDALRAVRAAVEMRAALERLNKELEREHDVRIVTRTGVNTGEVVSGDARTEQKLATGDAVNVAARLEQAAPAGEILLGAQTFRLVRDVVEAETVAPIAVKGKSEPVSALRVIDVLEDVPVGEERSPFVGRQAELVALGDAFAAAAQQQRCALATIVGPPGLGKSRLARELASTIGADAHIATGRCLAYGEGVTYAPLAEIVDQLTTDLEDFLVGEDEGTVIEDRIKAAIGLSDATASPEEIAWAFRKLFEVAGRDRPLVVVVDDIHWAESVLLDLLEYVLGFSSGAAILFVCLARPDLFDVRPTWATPRPNTTLVSLEPLTDDDARGLIDGLGRERQLGDATRAQIVAAAEGYPLFVEQMLALHADDPHGELVVPPTIQALLAARIDRLEPEERDVLTRASVEGRLFHRGAVSELLEPDAREGVGTHLLSLLRKQFLVPDRALFAGDDGFRFGHALIRDAAYTSMPKQLRAELHERYARWLEEHASADEYIEIVAFHLELAWRYCAELGIEAHELAREGGERLWSAARATSSRMEISSAVGLYDRAVQLLPDEPSGDLLREFAATLNRRQESERAHAVVEHAIERTQAAGNRRGELRARLDRFWIVPAGRGLRENARVRQEVEALIPELEVLDDHAALTNAWQLVGMSHKFAGRHECAVNAQREAQRHARELGDRLEESEARVRILESTYEGPVPVAAAIRLCEEEVREGSDDWMIEASALACTAVLHAMGGEFDEAGDRIERSIAMCREFNLWNVKPLIEQRTIALLAGDFAAAETALRAAEQEFDAYESWWGVGFLLRASLAAVICGQGRYDEVAVLTEAMPSESGDWVVPHTVWRSARAQALARLDRVDEAIALAREAVSLSEPTDALNLRGDALLAQADVFATCGRDAEAARSIDAALELYERKGTTVMADRARALAARQGSDLPV